eukprot:scaffold73_cov252-Pinguiococcus_pyrenoidosus.AAC.14
MAYLFMIVYAWLFLGFEWRLELGSFGVTICRPISTLATLCILYVLLAIASFGVFSFGLWGVSQADCVESIPELYHYSSLIVALFFTIGIVHFGVVLITMCGATAKSAAIMGMQAIKETRTELRTQHLLQAAEKRFRDYDTDNDGALDAAEARALLKEVNGMLTEKEIQAAVRRLDESGDGEITLEEFLDFYREFVIVHPDEESDATSEADQISDDAGDESAGETGDDDSAEPEGREDKSTTEGPMASATRKVTAAPEKGEAARKSSAAT